MTHSRVEARRLALIEIQRSLNERGLPPTRREISVALGWASPSTAQEIIGKLIEEGLIRVEPGIPRGIRITAMGAKALTVEV